MTETPGKKRNYDKYQQELVRLRRHFHKYPELALKEFKTSAFIREYLEGLGYEITLAAPTGLLAELPALKEKEKLVILRAEMDGLPIEEQTGLPYASVHDGCMHACGHDAILAAALVTAKIAAEEGEAFPVRVRFLFEPAEEIGEGAKRMLLAGALNKENGEYADGFLMFHYACDQTFGMAVHQGQASAMIAGMNIHIRGKSSHWCQAEKGRDSIYAAALAAAAVHDLSQGYQGKGHCLAGIGCIHGGEYPNIIADHVVLNGNIRACYEEDFQNLKKGLLTAFEEINSRTGCEITMEFPREPVLPFANDDSFTALAAEKGREIFGERFLLEGEDELFLSGDNAFRYFQKTRGLFVIFLAAVPGEPHPLHHPKFVLDEKILSYSVEALCEILGEIGKR